MSRGENDGEIERCARGKAGATKKKREKVVREEQKRERMR